MNLHDLRLRLRALVSPRRVEHDLDEEMAFHIEREAHALQAAGLGVEEARRRARARFGSMSVAADDCRDARGLTLVDGLVRDVVYAIRSFRRSPAVAATVVVTVALGLAMTVALFTIYNALVFRRDAVRDQGGLYTVVWPVSGRPSGRLEFTWRKYEAFRRDSGVFDDAFARRLDISTRVEGYLLEAQLVTGNYFQLLGVGAALGRTLTPADTVRPGGEPVIVLSHQAWKRAFNSDPNVIGRSVLINGFQCDIVGVTPEGFSGLDVLPVGFWAPITLIGPLRNQAEAANPTQLEIVGRLKPGMSLSAARAALAAGASNSGSDLPLRPRTAEVRLEPTTGAAPFVLEMLLVFSPLIVAFSLILLIACANVANLMLARGFARQREIGIRLSLGASRGRIVRQLLVESLLLALAAAVLALVLSRALLVTSISTLTATMPPEVAELFQLVTPSADGRVVGFLVIAAVVSTVLFGLLPALQATRPGIVRVVRGEIARDVRPGRARSVLIALQVTGSVLLLITAGVFLRGALRAGAIDPGLQVDDSIMIEFNEPARPAILAAMVSEPSVAALAATWPGGPFMNRPRAAFGSADDRAGTSRADYRFVSPEYFSVFDLEPVRGRVFTRQEGTERAAVAVVTDTAARRIWPNVDAVGRVLHLEPDASDPRRPSDPDRDEPALPSRAVVIGVVPAAAGFAMGYSDADVYLPTSLASAEATLIAQVRGELYAARRAILSRLTTIDPNFDMVFSMRTVGSMQTYLLGVVFWVTVMLGILALGLTLSGIFSVLSYVVVQRTKEIGVRMALGATTGAVTRLVLWESLRVVAIGLTIGVGLAWMLATLLTSLKNAAMPDDHSMIAKLVNVVHVFDGVAYAGSLVAIIAASVFASLAPARRAARIDPIATLRHD